MTAKNVTQDMSRMSLQQRARLAALVENDGDPALRGHLLGVVGEAAPAHRGRRATREIPPQWTQIHVLDRLEEAYRVLAGMPVVAGPKQYGNGMPTVVQERMTNKDWIDLYESGEIDQMQEDRNRVRLAATSAEVTRMSQALDWPAEYLKDRPELARAISLRALWAMMRADIRKQCRRRGLDHETFNCEWQLALNLITARLIARRVPVS